MFGMGCCEEEVAIEHLQSTFPRDPSSKDQQLFQHKFEMEDEELQAIRQARMAQLRQGGGDNGASGGAGQYSFVSQIIQRNKMLRHSSLPHYRSFIFIPRIYGCKYIERCRWKRWTGSRWE